MSATSKKVFTIPAGMPFARALAQKILDESNGNPEQLAPIKILLPTRRACRVVRDAFLKISDGKPLILPTLQPLGDIDEEELSFALGGQAGAEEFLNLPPAITPLHRQLLLAQLISGMQDYSQGFDHALALAKALGRFMDQIYTENLDMADLKNIVPDDFAGHWQITLRFLEILSIHWPQILANQGVIDIAQRRNKLILALGNYWRQNSPTTPVIAAGSTGSIPAVAELLSVVADLPQGMLVLPGLDQDMDAQSWEALEESHPQFGLKHLLDHLKITRKDVKTWPGTIDHEIAHARRILASEMMRPASTTSSWTDLKTKKSSVTMFQKSFSGLTRFDCEHPRAEAETIAVLMRETLQDDGKIAALITPDRALARRVAMACERWGIKVDDSAGESLDQVLTGSYLRLLLRACLDNLTPASALALFKHKFFDHAHAVQALEIEALRGPRPGAGFPGLYARLDEKAAGEYPNTKQIETACKFLNTLEPILAGLLQYREGAHNFRDILKAHLTAAENLTLKDMLWNGEDGEAAATLLSDLFEESSHLPPMDMRNYAGIIDQLLSGVTVRPAYGTHPRLMILGQLEARLIDADLVILGGLNEGSWPPEPGHDPWMSRQMREEFKLPGYERSIGLAAHDFVQGFCAPRVVLTRSKRKEGAPTVPSRWLQRLDTVLEAAGLSDQLEQGKQASWAQNLDHHATVTPFQRPEPRPPVNKRPRKLSATKIEAWQKDPYSIYARYILRLKKLDPLEQDPDAAARGTVIHDVLNRFVEAHKITLPENAKNILRTLAQEEISKRNDDPALWSFWWPRFDRIADAYIAHEQEWRIEAKPHLTEAEGSYVMQEPGGPFTFTAKADRIDRMSGGAAIIDYKTGGTFTQKHIKTGALPQLGVEALILERAGFGEGPMPVQSVSYWLLSGSNKGDVATEIRGVDDIVTLTEEGLRGLITAFDDAKTPYYSLPDPARAPRFNDYEHLARVLEWAALGESDTGEAA